MVAREAISLILVPRMDDLYEYAMHEAIITGNNDAARIFPVYVAKDPPIHSIVVSD